MPSEAEVEAAARAILDGTSPDWSGLDSSRDVDVLGLTAQLKILSTLAGVHRSIAVSSVNAAESQGVPVPGSWGQLKLLERVGAGAFGEVFRAWDTRLDREVALKLLPTSVSSA